MDRLESLDPPVARAQHMFRHTVALWAFDVLAKRPAAQWPADDPVEDWRDRDWRRLYTGSILDD